eukprot:411418_1
MWVFVSFIYIALHQSRVHLSIMKQHYYRLFFITFWAHMTLFFGPTMQTQWHRLFGRFGSYIGYQVGAILRAFSQQYYYADHLDSFVLCLVHPLKAPWSMRCMSHMVARFGCFYFLKEEK